MVSSRILSFQGQGDATRQTANVEAVVGPLARALNPTPIMGAPQPPWIVLDLLNGYATQTGFQAPSYFVDCLGGVVFAGSASNATGVGALTPIFLLPLALRPLFNRAIVGYGSGGASALVLSPDGNASWLGVVAAAGSVALDGIRFVPGV